MDFNKFQDVSMDSREFREFIEQFQWFSRDFFNNSMNFEEFHQTSKNCKEF